MRKHHSKKIFDKLKSFVDFIMYWKLMDVDEAWNMRLRELESVMCSIDDCVGMFCDDWERIHEHCPPHTMLKFNKWWKEALAESVSV